MILKKFQSISLDSSDTPETINNRDLYDLVADHDLIAPYEMCASGIGLLSILINRQITDMSFSKLYQLR
jgi:hypothetical protein